jgi:hypothetical protein
VTRIVIDPRGRVLARIAVLVRGVAFGLDSPPAIPPRCACG